MPGGRLEEYEVQDACWRELGEETAIWVNKNQLIHRHALYVCYDDNYGKRDFVFTLFRLDLTRQPPVTIKRQEHSAYCWVAPNIALGMPLVRDQDEFLRLCCPELTGNVQSGFLKECVA
jgi:ADP-ribose pyrophosphatase YjhB (NUDIX family)